MLSAALIILLPMLLVDVHGQSSCHPTPADVVFVLDSSSSLTEQQFKKQLEFVANYSSIVPIGPRDFQISVVTYSSNAYVEFYLNEYADNISLIDAVLNITYKRGYTYTDKGLRAVISVFSSGNGTERRINGTQAARFAYILTDGMSTDRIETKQAATELTTYVDTVAVIGIGNRVSHQALMDIASTPSFVYSVNNFNSLYTGLKRLVHFDCDGSCHPTPADVVFVLDSSVSMTEQQFKKQLEFVANFSSNVPIGPRDFQISVVTYSFNAHVEFYLNEYADNISLIDAVLNITYKPGATFTDKGLRAAISVFSIGHGIERRINGTQAARFAYVLTDGMSTDRRETKKAATELTTYVNTVAVIGIGNQVSHQELMDIATTPSFVYSVNNFNSLYTVLKRLVHFDCDECENSAESDVAIFLDSSADMTYHQYDASKHAIIHIIDVMKQLSVNETRVSITSFSDVILDVFKMGETFNKNIIKSTVNKIDQGKEFAQLPIVKVLSYARTQIFNNIDSRASGKKFLLIFTNGQHRTTDVNELNREKEVLEAHGVHIIAVGSGDGLCVKGLFELVTDAFNVLITGKDTPESNLDVLQSEFVYNKCDLKGE